MAQTNNILGGQVFAYGTQVYQDFTLHRGDDYQDPAGLQVWVTKPDKTVTHLTFGTDSEVTKLGTGKYRLTQVPRMAGEWAVHVETTDPIKTVEWSFRVSQTNVGA